MRRVTSWGRGCRKAGSRDAWLPALDALWAGAAGEAVCRLLRGCGRTAAEVLLLRCEFNGRCGGRVDGAPCRHAMLQGSHGLDGAASSFAGTLELRCAVQSPDEESHCLGTRQIR